MIVGLTCYDFFERMQVFIDSVNIVNGMVLEMENPFDAAVGLMTFCIMQYAFATKMKVHSVPLLLAAPSRPVG